MKAGLMGEPVGPPSAAPEIQELYFDIVSGSPGPTRSASR